MTRSLGITLLFALAACGGSAATDGGVDGNASDALAADFALPDAPGCIDSDGDGHAATSCGGDDCDDHDASRYPGNHEVCDAAGHDDDCDPATLGPDADGDGFPATTCCDLQPTGTLLCGRDCDDARNFVNPTAPEVCDGIDDNCDGRIDESVCVDECALGTPCGAGLGTCTDTFTGYTCACNAGYSGPAVGGPCVDVDECIAGTDDCDHDPPSCVNTAGSFTCTCPAGFSGGGTGTDGCVLADPSLSALVPSAGALSPVFAGATTAYTVALPPGVTSFSLSPSVAYPTRATITVDGTAVTSGTASTASAVTGFAPIVFTVTVTTETGATRTYTVVVARGDTYIKASNTDMVDGFSVVAISADGSTLAVGAASESSNATGIGGDQTNNAASHAGAVYVFTRAGSTWSQQAYLKASNTDADDYFGAALALSTDGSTLVVGAPGEASNATGIGGDQTNNAAANAGAVYAFTRAGTTWSQQAYGKASNAGAGDRFGVSVTLSDDGSMLAVGAWGEGSNARSVGGDQTNNAAPNAGAVYVLTRSGTSWSQQAYIKASNADAGDLFGTAVALSADGSTLAVSAESEDSSATGVGGNQADNSLYNPGAAYVFTRSGTAWSQQAYVKPSDTNGEEYFGAAVGLSSDGSTLAIGANFELTTGAVYMFTRAGTAWAQQALLQASNAGSNDNFGVALALSGDGITLVVGAWGEASNATGIGGDPTNNSESYAGAAYVFTLAGSAWSQQAYVKASNTDRYDQFGYFVALSDSGTLAVGAFQESSNATGVGGDQTNNASLNSGAVYVY